MKIASHTWLEITPGKISLPFETMKNIAVLTMNSFYDEDVILQKTT